MIRTRTLSEIALAISTDCWAASVSPRAGLRTSSATPSSARIASASRNMRAPVDHGAAALVADEDVLGDIEVGEEHRLLVDRRDAVALRLRRVADGDVLPGQQDLAAVRLVDAGHDLDQRRLAGAVLAEEGVDLAGIERQRHVLQRLGRAESLGDVAHFEDRRGARARGAGWPRRAGSHVSSRRFRGVQCHRGIRLPFDPHFSAGRPSPGSFFWTDYIETLSWEASLLAGMRQ